MKPGDLLELVPDLKKLIINVFFGGSEPPWLSSLTCIIHEEKTKPKTEEISIKSDFLLNKILKSSESR